MSPDRPPSPVQPRVVISAMHDVSQVQRHSLLGDSYLGRPQLRQIQTRPFPNRQTSYSQQPRNHGKHILLSQQLPPIDTSLVSSNAECHGPDKPLAISNLLSSIPSPRKCAARQVISPRPDNARPTYDKSNIYYTGSRDYDISLNDSRDQIASRPPGPSHPWKSWQAQRQQLNQTPTSTPFVSFYSETDEPHHSPASTVRSSAPSYHRSPSEHSRGYPSAVVYKPASSPQMSRPPPFTYSLSIRQQPLAARACGFGERDRRVVDPPPILELKITDKRTGAPEQDPNAMLALHCTLLSMDGNEEDSQVDVAYTDVPSARRLMGTLVASPYQAKDEHGVAGTFFVFSDLSCRSPGTYKLQFKLLRVDPMLMMPGVKHGCVALIETSAFTVYTAKDFPGMRASTALLTALREQGLTVGLKKGTEARIGQGSKRKGNESSDEDGEGESEDDGPPDGGLDDIPPTDRASRKTTGTRRSKRGR